MMALAFHFRAIQPEIVDAGNGAQKILEIPEGGRFGTSGGEAKPRGTGSAD